MWVVYYPLTGSGRLCLLLLGEVALELGGTRSAVLDLIKLVALQEHQRILRLSLEYLSLRLQHVLAEDDVVLLSVGDTVRHCLAVALAHLAAFDQGHEALVGVLDVAASAERCLSVSFDSALAIARVLAMLQKSI